MLRRLSLLMATMLSNPAWAITFEVPVQGSRELTLAIDEPVAPAGDPGVADVLWQTVQRDLDLTGYFDLVDKAAFLDRSRGVEPGSFDFADWRVVKAAALAKLRVLPNGQGGCDAGPGRVCADVYVYDVLGAERLTAKRMKAGEDAAHALGHEIASAILMALVGEAGFFTGTLAAVGERGGNKEVYALDVGGDRVRPLTRNGSINLSPAWSADGGSLAWASFKRGDADVFVKDLRSGRVRTVANGDGVEISPAFSPDGRTLAIARSSGEDTDIWLVDARTGQDVRQLTRGGGIDVSPMFSPDGSKVLFASERGGSSSIYEVPVAGGPPRRVTPFPGFFTDPVYSPDGRKVAFVSRKGNFDVLVVGIDGSGLSRVTQDMGDNEDPCFSPDGRYLVFSSTRKGGRRLWLSTVDGRHQVAITDSGGWSQPVWRP
jgi:TolB protein